MVPVGQETLGRIMNVIGEPVDERGPIESKAKVQYTISRQVSSFARRRIAWNSLACEPRLPYYL